MEYERLRYLWDSQGLVKKLIEKWQPGNLGSERASEDSLYDYLHQQFDYLQVTRQYARGRATVDLVIGDQVMIELKHNLTSTSELQRLKGQLMEYKSWKMAIIIVLTGETDKNLLKDLTRFIQKEIDSNYLLDNGVILIQK
jgi:hypothetical protein